MRLQSLPWIDPLAVSVDEPYWALLYSGVQTDYSGRYSYLACGLRERVEGDWETLRARLRSDRPVWEHAWFGYLGYGLKDSLESLPPDAPNWLRTPPLCMMRFGRIYIFDHAQRSVQLWHDDEPAGELQRADALAPIPPVTQCSTPMPKAAYMAKAAAVIDAIRRGDLYQANLTRKTIGRFERAPDPLAVFRHLCRVSPAPYSAFLKMDTLAVASSSPELFLRVDAHGRMLARPIKGTAPRFSDPARDAQSRQALAASDKDKAENLMIVDLMRNDFSRACLPGSVRADALFDITSHANVHHLSSTITGKKSPDCPTLDAVARCFPPGSMTGAPKIKAMQLCSGLEQLERGIYSGAIGWFGGDGSCELSVVIRTLLMQGNRFEFQVGGGIVADSTPENEFQEILDKASGLCNALGISGESLL